VLAEPFDMPTCVSVGSVTNDYVHYIRVTGTVSLVCTGNTAHDLNVKLRLSVISLSTDCLQAALLQQIHPSRTVASASMTNSGLEDDISSCQSEIERKHTSKIVLARARTTYNESSDTANYDDKDRATLPCEDIHPETSPSKHDQASIATAVRALLDKLHWYGVDAVLPKKRHHGGWRKVISQYYVYFVICALLVMPPLAVGIACSFCCCRVTSKIFPWLNVNCTCSQLL
jgi:hypothetical protein